MLILHWAAIPLETVFEGYETMACNWLETECQGVKMVVEPLGNGTGKIVRLLSPIPSDYLNPNYAPGSIVTISQAK
jgi:hypothetical protein